MAWEHRDQNKSVCYLGSHMRKMRNTLRQNKHPLLSHVYADLRYIDTYIITIIICDYRDGQKSCLPVRSKNKTWIGANPLCTCAVEERKWASSLHLRYAQIFTYSFQSGDGNFESLLRMLLLEPKLTEWVKKTGRETLNIEMSWPCFSSTSSTILILTLWPSYS